MVSQNGATCSAGNTKTSAASAAVCQDAGERAPLEERVPHSRNAHRSWNARHTRTRAARVPRAARGKARRSGNAAVSRSGNAVRNMAQGVAHRSHMSAKGRQVRSNAVERLVGTLEGGVEVPQDETPLASRVPGHRRLDHQQRARGRKLHLPGNVPRNTPLSGRPLTRCTHREGCTGKARTRSRRPRSRRASPGARPSGSCRCRLSASP